MTTLAAPPATLPPREAEHTPVDEQANGQNTTRVEHAPALDAASVQARNAALFLPFHRLSVTQYQQMIASGILDEDDAVELLDGWIVDKMPKNPPHSHALRHLRPLITPLVPPGYVLDFQEPITLGRSEPEPDTWIARGETNDYEFSHPTGEQMMLVLEISHSTLAQDRTVKQRLYAEARIPYYWILNLIDRATEVYANPHGDRENATYDAPMVYAPDQLVPLVLDGVEVAQFDLRACYGSGETNASGEA